MGNVFELRAEHTTMRVGRTTFHEADDGLAFQAVADGTETGDRALGLVTGGHVRGVSLCYVSLRMRYGRDGVQWRTRGQVRELSLTERPQYADAGVVLVRSVSTMALLDRARAVLAVDPNNL